MSNPIAPFIDELRPCSDDELLAKLAALPPLPDDTDPCWDDLAYWDTTAHPLLAITELVGERRLRAAVPLILARACHGDLYGTMSGLRHGFEAAFAPDWPALAEVCLAAIETGRPGTVMWAIGQLTLLEYPPARPVLALWARSTDERIADLAAIAVERIDRPLR